MWHVLRGGNPLHRRKPRETALTKHRKHVARVARRFRQRINQTQEAGRFADRQKAKVRAFARRQRTSVLSGEGGGVSWGSHPGAPRPHHNPQRGPTPEPIETGFLEAQMAAFVASLMRQKASADPPQGHKDAVARPQETQHNTVNPDRTAALAFSDGKPRVLKMSHNDNVHAHKQQSPCDRPGNLGDQGTVFSSNAGVSPTPSYYENRCESQTLRHGGGGEETSVTQQGFEGKVWEGKPSIAKERAKTSGGQKGGPCGSVMGKGSLSGRSRVQTPRPAWALTAEAADAAEEDEEARILGFVDELDAEALEKAADLAELAQEQPEREAHGEGIGTDPGLDVGAASWKRDFVRAMNQLVMWDMRGSEGDEVSAEGRSADRLPSVCTRSTVASMCRRAESAERAATSRHGDGESHYGAWDASTQVGSEGGGAGASVGTRDRMGKAWEVLRDNPELRSIHSHASVAALLEGVEKLGVSC